MTLHAGNPQCTRVWKIQFGKKLVYPMTPAVVLLGELARSLLDQSSGLTIADSGGILQTFDSLTDVPDGHTIIIASGYIDSPVIMGCNSRSKYQFVVSFPFTQAFVTFIKFLSRGLALVHLWLKRSTLPWRIHARRH